MQPSPHGVCILVEEVYYSEISIYRNGVISASDKFL